MARREELTDEQWAIIAPLIPEPPRREHGHGRLWKDSREVINGIFWVLRSGPRSEDMPDRFPPYQTCHRRFQQWVRDGVLRSVLEAPAEDLRARGDFDLSECFIDGMSVVAKKVGSEWERPSGAAEIPSLVSSNRRVNTLAKEMPAACQNPTLVTKVGSGKKIELRAVWIDRSRGVLGQWSSSSSKPLIRRHQSKAVAPRSGACQR